MFDRLKLRGDVARWRGFVPVVALAMLVLAGCDTALETFVGQNPKNGPQTPMGATPSVPSSAAFITGTETNAVYGGTGVLPPTLSFTDQGGGNDEPAAGKGPNRPVAAVPLSVDGAKLAPLVAAARTSNGPDARFVLLVLAPPAGDAAALDTTNAAARSAAGAAVQALAGAGVASDRVEVAMATNPNVGAGEMRLYLK
jgi:hypothetical protein